MVANASEKEMPFWEHLEEFRWVILKSLAVLTVFTGVLIAFTDPIYQLLLKPVEAAGGGIELITTSPLDAFLTKLKLSVLAGFFASAPFILKFVWSFVAPGLYENERKVVWVAVFVGCIQFAVGVVFGFFILRTVLPFLAEFSPEGVANRWSIRLYMNFCVRMLLAVGVVFELPVVLVVLVRLGILQTETLVKARPYAVVIAFVVSAILTPPDPLTQIMLGVPLVLLYELSVWIARWQDRWLPSQKVKDGD